MLSSIISIYLGSKIFKGTVVFGKIIKFDKGNTEIIFGRFIISKYIYLNINILN
jgi:hypothetical protein